MRRIPAWSTFHHLCWVSGVAASTVLSGTSSGSAQRRPAPPPETCRFEVIGSGTVARVSDGRGFVLQDGREVRLAAIDTPIPLASGELPAGDAAAQAARDALSALIGGNPVVLKGAGPQTDRYGRIVAHVFIGHDGRERWVQEDLVGSGHARVEPASDGCIRPLLTAERRARSAKLGLWADPYYELRWAEKPAAILAERGRFTVVQGKVLSVRESGGTIYVNFGRRWTEDFTVTISKRNERAFTAAGIEPKKLDGRHVRIRGWVEERGGPWIEATRPEQIEFVEQN